MSRSYFTEDQKLITLIREPWGMNACYTIKDILNEKGYYVNCVMRIGADGKPHDALQVEREDVPQLVEQLFRQRFTVEVQAEGNGKASINFVYDYPASVVLTAVEKFQRNICRTPGQRPEKENGRCLGSRHSHYCSSSQGC